jgi:type II secretory ATPase GspE/PulE/Tfp pilus assembly ATPase PilB-like protein
MDNQQILEEHMKAIRIKEKEQEAKMKAGLFGFPYVFLEKFPIASDALGLIPEEKAQKIKAVSFYRGLNEVRVGAIDPLSSEVKEILDEFKSLRHLTPVVYLISEYSFECAFKLYALLPKIRKQVAGVEITEDDFSRALKGLTSLEDLAKKAALGSVSEVLTVVISGAVKYRASDIHFEAGEGTAKARYRIDGMLHDIAELSKETWSRVLSRIKLLSGLKINIENKPQDGRFTIFLKDDRIEVRVSVIPTAYGESVVMRILRSEAEQISFEELGLTGYAREILEREIKRPAGMILNCGPTGSGKTTTLYAILKTLNTPEVKIFTVEDPIEYKITGVSQSQVDPNHLYNFATALRSVLRHDPDIIMIGEIRDPETNATALQAALTGHLVLSTVHTNNAAAAIPRLISLEGKPFLIAPALNVVVAQRLVRRICPKCKEKIVLPAELLRKVKEVIGDLKQSELTFWQGKGCEACLGFGYQGRLGIFEVIPMSEELKEYILKAGDKVSEYEILKLAQKNGMISMVEDGLLKAAEGITTVEEVFRVTE